MTLFPSHDSQRQTNQDSLFSCELISFTTLFYLGDCDEDWVEFQEKCYQVTEELMNFKFAQEYCKSLQAQVANIETKRKNIFIRNCTSNAETSGYLWIGVQKICLNCTQTIDGYTNWAAGEPNGASSCVMMDPRGQWHDFDCGYKFAFVCEKGWFVSKDISVKYAHLRLSYIYYTCRPIQAVNN